MDGIRAAGVYAEADFRINQSAFRNFDRFEKKIDKLKKKLESLSSPNINIGGRVGSGGAGGGGIGRSGGRSGEGWYWNTIGKVAYNMRKREAMVNSAITGMHNTYRTLKIPQKEMERLNAEVTKYGEKLKSGEMISAEFAVKLKRIKSEARDLHKQLNVPAPKYSKELNKGFMGQLTNIAKAKNKQDMQIIRAEFAFQRAAKELNIVEGSKAWVKHHNQLQQIISDYRSAPVAVNDFKKSIGSLDLQMRAAGKQGFAGMLAKMREFRHGVGLFVAAAVGMGLAADNIGVKFNNMNLQMQTSFGVNAAREVAFVRQEADRLGVSVLEASKAWAKLGVSAQIGGFKLQDTRELFQSMLGISRAMGLSTEQLALSFHAVTQAYSKGALTSEDLSGQLAEHIPGVVALTQKALGFTGKGDEFAKALKNKEFTPEKFAKALAKVFKEQAGDFENSEFFQYGKSRQGMINQVESTMYRLFKGMEPRLMLLFDNLSFFIKTLEPLWQGLGTMVIEVITGITTAIRLFTAFVMDAYKYFFSDDTMRAAMRKEIGEALGMDMRNNPTLTQSAMGLLSPISDQAIGNYIADIGKAVGDAIKETIKISISASPEFHTKMTTGAGWNGINTATTE